MHAVLGRSINTPIVISDDDEGEIIDLTQPAVGTALPVPHMSNTTMTMPAGVTTPHNGMDVIGALSQGPITFDDPATRLLKRFETGQPSSYVGQQATGGEVNLASEVEINGFSNNLKRKRTDSIGGLGVGQKPLNAPSNVAAPVATWEAAQLSKKQRKKLNKRLREQAEQRVIPPVENILGWSAQFRDDVISNVSTDQSVTSYPHSTPPPPSHTPPPIPIASPPSHSKHIPPPRVQDNSSDNFTPLFRQASVTQDSNSRRSLHQRDISVDCPVSKPQNIVQQGLQARLVQSSQDARFHWQPSWFANNCKIIGSASDEKVKGMFPLDSFQVHPLPSPERTLIMNPVPRKFRTPEYFYSWCDDARLPRPQFILTHPKNTKTLIEFASAEHACLAYNSPRLKNVDGRASMRLFWYHPLRPTYETPSHRSTQPSPKPSHRLLHPSKPSAPPPVVRDDMEEGEICEDEDVYTPFLDANNGHPDSMHVAHELMQGERALHTVNAAPLSLWSEMDIDTDATGRSEVSNDAKYIEQHTVVVPTSSSSDGMESSDDPKSNERQQILGISEVTRSNAGVSDIEPSPVEIRSSSSEKLEELRQRVLASKRKRNAVMNSRSDQETVPSTPSISMTSSSSSVISLTTTSFSKSSIVVSHSLPNVPSNEPTARLQELATDFLNSILGPPKRSYCSYQARLDRKSILEEKQRRLERHIADSKQLMSKYTKASSKIEKEEIVKVIRDKNRRFDAENAESDAALQRIEKEAQFTFAWPETKRDDTILVISDSEDELSDDDGDL